LTNESCERGCVGPRIHTNGDTALTAPQSAIRDAMCPCASATAGRRALLGAGISLGVGLVAGAARGQSDPAHERPQEGDLLVRVGSATPTPLTPDSLQLGAGQIMTWPMDPAGNIVRDGSRLNKVLLLRLDPSVLDAQTSQRAASGVVGYSAICPHTGCEVVNWLADKQILDCPCHNSEYDPKAGARVVSGPSPRSLAALPLRVADGKLVVARSFIGRLGIQQI
jgi:rieske iron-sulfur protein